MQTKDLSKVDIDGVLIQSKTIHEFCGCFYPKHCLIFEKLTWSTSTSIYQNVQVIIQIKDLSKVGFAGVFNSIQGHTLVSVVIFLSKILFHLWKTYMIDKC